MYRNTDSWQLIVRGKLPLTHWFSLDKGQREELMLALSVHNLNNMSHGQNIRPTPGQAEPIAQHFFKNSTTANEKPEVLWGHFYAVSSLCLNVHGKMLLVRRKLSLNHCLSPEIHKTHNRDREKSATIGATERNSTRPKVKLSFCAIFLFKLNHQWKHEI